MCQPRTTPNTCQRAVLQFSQTQWIEDIEGAVSEGSEATTSDQCLPKPDNALLMQLLSILQK